MHYIIYIHINKVNSKVYIGQTCQQNVQDRWKNGAGYKTCTYFWKAIQKYGWENFEHKILEEGEWTPDEANRKEQYYIAKYNSTNPQIGYNITKGGKNISNNANTAAVEWMKEHPEFGLARAQDMLKWQAEHPEEALRMRMENVKKASEARRKPVRCIETQIIYKSASEAARLVPKTTQSKICMVCRGQRKTCGGYHWEYVNQE